jgi:hypothetical protein
MAQAQQVAELMRDHVGAADRDAGADGGCRAALDSRVRALRQEVVQAPLGRFEGGVPVLRVGMPIEVQRTRREAHVVEVIVEFAVDHVQRRHRKAAQQLGAAAFQLAAGRRDGHAVGTPLQADQRHRQRL